MRLSQALKDKLMDVRMRDKLVADGKLTKEKVREAVKVMPDESAGAMYVQIEDSKKDSEDSSKAQ